MYGYLRLFSVLSLLTITAIAGFGGVQFRSVAMNDLTHLIQVNSISVGQGYINAVWSKYRDILIPIVKTDPSQLRTNPQVGQFAQETMYYFQGMPMVRINIYSDTGSLLMSANISQTQKLQGTPASPNSAFVSGQIKQGVIASNLLLDVPMQGATNAKMLQTIMPIRIGAADAGAPPEAVLELIADITPHWEKLAQFQIMGTGGIIAVFIIFLFILYLTTRKSESIIAKQHEANLELAAAAASAQAENREKSQFLANVSHELRTPLNAIIGFSDIIKTEVPALQQEKKYYDYICDINAAGAHLLSLINDILDYSKAEAGKLELEVSEVNASKMVQNCLRLVSPRAESANVQLKETLPKEHLIMNTDSKKFKQILLNLLSNAVKFTPPGGEVSVNGWHNVTDDTITFEVRDTGIGIAPKDISRAMAPFGQVDNTLKRKYEGTGLGLPLTKKFVELMGGKFNIESQVNVGTTITFTLPRQVMPREGIIIKQVA